MKFSNLILAAVSSLSIASTAQAATLDCTLDDEFDSWSVYVNEERDTAIFFDNDHNIALAKIDEGGNEGTASPYSYLFAGNDDGLIEQFILSRYPNGSVTGRLIVSPGTEEEEKHAMTCREMKAKEAAWIAWDEAKAALRDAEKNEGSTRF